MNTEVEIIIAILSGIAAIVYMCFTNDRKEDKDKKNVSDKQEENRNDDISDVDL